jgi:ABC-type branched-subunit amino acid transport system ATPase component
MLDEPTEGIQPSIVEEIIEILRAIRRRRGLTVIVVEQDLDFISALSERVLVIQRGRITGELDPEQLANPDVVQEFVGMGTR